MTAAPGPREDKLAERLLVIDPRERRFDDRTVRDLPRFVRPGDLLVVNDAGVLPGSLMGTTDAGEPVEARLVAPEHGGWKTVLFGAGDWHDKTEERPLPPALRDGSRLRFGAELLATVSRAISRRVAVLSFDASDDGFFRALYRYGRPIQYSYTRAPLSLFQVQTLYAAEPWAAEMPSAGRPLTASLLDAIKRRGAGVERVTHAAGLSSTGDAALDATLPWPERYRIPASTVEAIRATRARRGRVIAVGTTVVRALEGAANTALLPGEGTTSLVIGPGFVPRVVDALFTGIHEPSASHFSILSAFAPRPLLERAYEHAERSGYLGHEFGDSCLIL